MIIPITGKISLRNPPVVTIALILINCLVYFIFQAGDAEKTGSAFTYYFDSGLAEMEARAYIDYADAEAFAEAEDYGIDIPTADPGAELDEMQIAYVYQVMNADGEFIKELEKGNIITPDDPEFGLWKTQKTKFKDRLRDTTPYQYGFIPDQAKPVSAFTYMFLHGGFGHLLGNMVFLWLVGCILEIGCGRFWYSIWYVMGGFAAVGLFWLFNMESIQPLVGASGAISGLMGLMTVLYGFKKIKVFLTLGFYFNYFEMWGILLLPVWLGKEIYSQVTVGDASNVAFMAHAGGIIGGALLGLVNLKLIGMHDEKVFEAPPEDTVTPILEKALAAMEILDFDTARKFFSEYLGHRPGDITALHHLFHFEKLSPDSDRFHNAAQQLLSAQARTLPTHEKAKETYFQYMELTSRPKLPPDVFLIMSSVFLGSGEVEQSEKMLGALIKKKPRLNGLSAAVMRLSVAFDKNGNTKKAKYYQDIILSTFPDSHEAALVRGR